MTVSERVAFAGKSLRVRNYRLYFVGQCVSVAGNFMQTLAVAFLTLQLTGSGLDLGIVVAVRLVPFVVLGPWGGVFADQHDKRKLLFFTQTAQALGALVFAAFCWSGTMTYPLVLVLSLVLGCLTIFDNPARQAFISELVERDDLANAVALNSTSMNVARVIGSVAGGALVAVVGPGTCFLLNAVSFIAVLVSLQMMRVADLVPVERVPRGKGQVMEGLRYAARTPALSIPLVMLLVTGIVAYEFPTTLPLLATGAFHGTAVTYGIMSAVMAVGAIGGGLYSAARTTEPEPRMLAVVCIGWGASIVLTGMAPNLVTACVMLVFVGFGSITFNAAAKTALQLATDPPFRGRVMSLWAIAWIGSSVVGAPLVGWFAEHLGSRWGLYVGGVPTILLGLAYLPYLSRHRLAEAGA